MLTAFIIHLYISLYFNMNNAGGIRGGRGMWERGATQHVSLAVLCSCSPQSGGGGGKGWGGGGCAGAEGEKTRAWCRPGRRLRFRGCGSGPSCCLSTSTSTCTSSSSPDCLLTWLLLLSDLITAYKSKSLLSPVQPSLHSNGERVSLGPILIKGGDQTGL